MIKYLAVYTQYVGVFGKTNGKAHHYIKRVCISEDEVDEFLKEKTEEGANPVLADLKECNQIYCGDCKFDKIIHNGYD